MTNHKNSNLPNNNKQDNFLQSKE